MYHYMNDEYEILKWSEPLIAQANAYKYLGNDAKIYFSNRKGKKYKIFNPNTNKFVHFGDSRYADFTKHKDEERRQRYLDRATKIKGNWKKDKYSPNNLAINLLWNKDKLI